MLVGTWASEVIEITITNQLITPNVTLVCGHYTPDIARLEASCSSNEVWGLAVFPDGNRYVTAADDGTLRVWDVFSKKLHKLIDMKVGTFCENEVADASRGRTVDIIKTGKMCAVGFKDGSFRI